MAQDSDKQSAATRTFDVRATGNDTLREASGGITDKRDLVSFLYELMRDEIPAGTIQRALVNSRRQPGTAAWVFCNGFVAQYAQYVADQLGVKE